PCHGSSRCTMPMETGNLARKSYWSTCNSMSGLCRAYCWTGKPPTGMQSIPASDAVRCSCRCWELRAKGEQVFRKHFQFVEVERIASSGFRATDGGSAASMSLIHEQAV